MSTYRLIDTRTGQPLPMGDTPEAQTARSAARYAGAAHYVECDGDGYPLRDAKGNYNAATNPAQWNQEDRAALKESLRTDTRNPNQRQFFTSTEHSATEARAELAAKGYGAAALGRAEDHSGAPRVGQVQTFTPAQVLQMEAQRDGIVMTPTPQMG